MPAYLLGRPSLLGNPKPINWQGLGQALWDTNLNAPIRGVYNLMNTPYDVLAGDTGAAGQQAVADSFDAAGGVTVGSMPMPKPSNALSMGIKAYHGSPHSFDKFSMDKIGTGEGAQAYGHGLYFAEQEDIARSYRDALSPKKVAIGGEMVDSPTFFKAARRSPSVDDNIAMLTKQRENILKEQSQYTSDPELGDFVSELYDTQLKDVDREIAELSQYKGGWFGTRPGGSMYEVNIDADPNAFLDWDKPLSEQPEAVQKAFGDIVGRDLSKETGWGKLTGNEALTAVMERNGSLDWPVDASPALRAQYRDNSRSKASSILADKGIPGIKYLDAGSRGGNMMWVVTDKNGKALSHELSQDGAQKAMERLTRDFGYEGMQIKPPHDGTRNYVVFDDSLINILKKYGIAGLLGAGGMYGMSSDDAQARAR